MSRDENPESLVGAVLNRRIRLQRYLGEGGLALVYEGREADGAPPLAVKLLRREFHKDPEVVERFLGEALTAQRIDHPGVVKVFGSFTAEDGTPYIVEELLTGYPLSVPMNRGPLPIDEATRVLEQILDALEAAHTAGIVHRDLKPDNVFLEPQPSGEEHVRLLDFGISRVVEAAGGSARRTKTGMLLGTPGYMSPEQVRNSKDADRRSDLFSAGILFYELTTGRRAFSGATGYERMMAVLFADAVPIEQAAPQYAHWGPFFARALCREAEGRFQSATEMKEALHSVATSGRMPGGAFGGDRTEVSPNAPRNAPTGPPPPAIEIIEPKRLGMPYPRVGVIAAVTFVLGVVVGWVLGR